MRSYEEYSGFLFLKNRQKALAWLDKSFQSEEKKLAYKPT